MAVNVKEINIPKFGWRALNSALETMVSVIKATAPNVEGPGVSLTSHGDGGIEISLAQTGTGGSSGDSQQQQQQQGGTQDPHILIDSITWTGVKWQDVTVVDPSTCAQSTLSVLVNTGNVNDFITIDNSQNPFWAQP